MRDRLIGFALQNICEAQVVMSLGIGTEPQNFLEMNDRFLELAALREQKPQLLMRIKLVALYFQRSLEPADCAGNIARLGHRLARFAKPVCHPRLEAQGASSLFLGLIRV